MDKRSMEQFCSLSEDETMDICGGVTPVLPIIAVVIAAYVLARHIAYDAGKAKAYSELGY